MAVGVIFAGAISGNAGITMAGAFALAIGIAIQNFPEGAIISMPLKSEGMSKTKAFLLRSCIWGSRTNRCRYNISTYKDYNPSFTILIIFCSRGNDLCGNRRAYTRGTIWRAY